MSEEIIAIFKQKGFSEARTIVLTVRFDDFTTRTRSLTAREPIETVEQMFIRGLKLLLPFFEKGENPRNQPIRMLGLRLENLS